MIERRPQVAAGERFDLAVVGAGVQGIALALEAARRGLRPLLVERGDFGAATSWNSLRIIHGGLRSLQRLDLRGHRRSSRERAWFLRHFPDLVQPLPCLMPLYGAGLRRPAVFRLALTADRLLAGERGAAPATGRLLSAAATAGRFPGVERQGLRGGALWTDGVAPDSPRLLLEMLHWAAAAGAVALNYVEATGLRTAEGRVTGIEARDRATDERLRFDAPVVVSCAGPWCREVARRFDRDLPERFPLTVAFNLLLAREPLSDAALAVTPRQEEAASLFLLPWKGRILAGTRHQAWAGRRIDSPVDRLEVGPMLEQIRRAVPALDVGPGDVVRILWGFLPARWPGRPEQALRDLVLDHRRHGGPAGLFSVVGAKFTTARALAETALRRIARWRGRPLSEPGGPPRPGPVAWPSLDELERLMARDRDGAGRWLRDLAEREAVLHLDDVLLRRTDWGADPEAGRRTGESVARLLGWDEERVAREVAALAGTPA